MELPQVWFPDSRVKTYELSYFYYLGFKSSNESVVKHYLNCPNWAVHAIESFGRLLEAKLHLRFC